MLKSKEGIQLGATKKFSNYRCVKCHFYLVPLTEEKMALFGFTDKQKQRVKEYPEKLTHFCPKCMKAYQRQEKPLSEDLENCEYCGSELVLTSYEGEVTNILWCPECKKAYQITDERTLAKIGKLAEKSSRQALSKDFTENAE